MVSEHKLKRITEVQSYIGDYLNYLFVDMYIYLLSVSIFHSGFGHT